jgi:hypothetical protein
LKNRQYYINTHIISSIFLSYIFKYSDDIYKNKHIYYHIGLSPNFFEKFSRKYKQAIASYSVAICRKSIYAKRLFQIYAKNDFGRYSRTR